MFRCANQNENHQPSMKENQFRRFCERQIRLYVFQGINRICCTFFI